MRASTENDALIECRWVRLIRQRCSHDRVVINRYERNYVYSARIAHSTNRQFAVRELEVTTIPSMEIDQASAKLGSGLLGGGEENYTWPIRTGGALLAGCASFGPQTRETSCSIISS